MDNLRMLFFSAKYGAGHVKAAEALIEVVKDTEPSARIAHLDFEQFMNSKLNTVVKSAYLEVMKHTPSLWGKFYYGSSQMSPDSIYQRFVNRIGRTELAKYVHSFKPDIIVCTYPIVSGILAQLKVDQAVDIPLVTVVTDYTVHSQWIHRGVDLYIVGNNDVYDGLKQRGIEPGRIKVTGIPVSKKFEHKSDRRTVLAKLGLDDERMTFLVMGGAYGVLDSIKKICQVIAESPNNWQAIVVCGENKKLYDSLGSMIGTVPNPIARCGFVDNVDELMSAADLLITKAGGLTVSEALTQRLPQVIFKPNPGQELENANFLTHCGAAQVVDTIEDLANSLTGFARSPEKLAQMRSAAAHAIPEHASVQAVKNILQLAGKDESEQKTG